MAASPSSTTCAGILPASAIANGSWPPSAPPSRIERSSERMASATRAIGFHSAGTAEGWVETVGLRVQRHASKRSYAARLSAAVGSRSKALRSCAHARSSSPGAEGALGEHCGTRELREHRTPLGQGLGGIGGGGSSSSSAASPSAAGAAGDGWCQGGAARE